MKDPLQLAESGLVKVLIRSPNWIGDAVMSAPALARLRERHPGTHIVMLCGEKLTDLWRGHPAVNEMVTFTNRDSVWAVARKVRSHSPEAGLIFPNSFRSAFELWWAGVPKRIGYNTQGRGLLLTVPVSPRPAALRMRKRSRREILRLIDSIERDSSPLPESSAHFVHHYLHLAGFLGASTAPARPQIVVTEAEAASFHEKFGLPQDPAAPLLGLCPGAEYGAAKRWPAERFIAAATRLQRQLHCRWVIFGGPGDTALGESIAEGVQRQRAGDGPGSNDLKPLVTNLAGHTTLRELCAGLKACRVVLTNDTGPMHLAAATGTSVVAIFGSTSPALTGPQAGGAFPGCVLRANVPCSPCYLRECPIDFRCMLSITVDEVVAAVAKLSLQPRDS